MKFIPALALAVLATGVHGQTGYPDKPVRLVVGFSAGGPTDLPARFIADRLGTALGQRVIVENRPGAGGQIATQDVLSKPRDGYSLLLCTHFESINAAVYKNVAYKLSDLAPISQISRYYYAGAAQEVLALELAKAAGIRLTGIPYKGGADAVNDLIAGRVHLYVSPTLNVLPQYKAGRLRVLAVTSPERLAAAPQIPTLTEKGLAFVRFGWLGLCGGAGTPQPVIALLNRQVGAIVKSPEYRDLIEKAGSVAVSSSPEQLAQILHETYEQTAGIAREFGLQMD